MSLIWGAYILERKTKKYNRTSGEVKREAWWRDREWRAWGIRGPSGEGIWGDTNEINQWIRQRSGESTAEVTDRKCKGPEAYRQKARKPVWSSWSKQRHSGKRRAGRDWLGWSCLVLPGAARHLHCIWLWQKTTGRFCIGIVFSKELSF